MHKSLNLDQFARKMVEFLWICAQICSLDAKSLNFIGIVRKIVELCANICEHFVRGVQGVLDPFGLRVCLRILRISSVRGMFYVWRRISFVKFVCNLWILNMELWILKTNSVHNLFLYLCTFPFPYPRMEAPRLHTSIPLAKIYRNKPQEHSDPR